MGFLVEVALWDAETRITLVRRRLMIRFFGKCQLRLFPLGSWVLTASRRVRCVEYGGGIFTVANVRLTLGILGSGMNIDSKVLNSIVRLCFN
jgi:hypothetical protein